MAGIALLIVALIAYIGYGAWLHASVKSRHISTTLSADAVRSIFEQKVARAGWKVVDTGNPIVAQSSLATGIRQQIGLQVTSVDGGRTQAVVGPQRLVRKWHGVPTKAHTLRVRMNSFTAAVRAQDGAAVVATR
jgi:hypothetical protein